MVAHGSHAQHLTGQEEDNVLTLIQLGQELKR